MEKARFYQFMVNNTLVLAKASNYDEAREITQRTYGPEAKVNFTGFSIPALVVEVLA